MHFKHYENPYSGLAQYVNCAAANPGADAGMYDASEQYKLSTRLTLTFSLPDLCLSAPSLLFPTFTFYHFDFVPSFHFHIFMWLCRTPALARILFFPTFTFFISFLQANAPTPSLDLIHFLPLALFYFHFLPLISSVRSSNSHPDLLLTHQQQHPTFSDHTGPQHWTFTFWATTAI